MFIPFDIEFLLGFSHRKSHWEALVLFPVFPISWAADGVLAAASWKSLFLQNVDLLQGEAGDG